ncbi:hypothetical protein [Planctomycetes bacterium TBK1r]
MKIPSIQSGWLTAINKPLVKRGYWAWPLAKFDATTLFLCAALPFITTVAVAQQPTVDDADRMVAVTISANQADRQPPVGNSARRLCRAEPDKNIPDWNVEGWQAYQRLWNELAANPDDPALRKYLGLPIGSAAERDTFVIKSARGRSAPKWLGWRSGSYRQVETPHLQLFSHADEATTREVATDMERVYWIWTQLFFPLWEGNHQVALHLRDIDPEQSVASSLANNPARLASRRKLRIVLLKDADDYARTLGTSTPGISQSTGLYSDQRQTSFFYPSPSADAVASRRHELVHQLFREATRSRLTGELPGARADFWLIEGIAGYFESLHVDRARATVGGWDSPRLQFARYRVLGGRDFIPLQELRTAGHAAAQQQSDLARWYANAIAYTHLLLDGDSVAHRRWVYQQLATLYQIPLDVPAAAAPESPERGLIDFLRVDDAVLRENPTSRPLTQLCFSNCETTPTGLASLTTSTDCQWMDLSRQPVATADVTRLCPTPNQLDQLSLEATRVDDSIHAWLRQATNLRELDLSWTTCGDQTVAAVANHNALQTLWLTGTQVTDASIPTLAAIGTLQSIDVQRTAITSAGLAKLKTLRPDCNINPLQLRVQ